MKDVVPTDVLRALEKPYLREGFSKFVQFILDSTCCDDTPKPYDISPLYTSHIQGCVTCGSYTDGEHPILILEVLLSSHNSMWEEGDKQRAFVSNILHNDTMGYAGALVAFVPQDSVSWVLSWLPNGFDRRVEGRELMPLERYSFWVGTTKGSYTLRCRLLSVLRSQNSTTVQKMNDIFHVESYTQEFCIQYKVLFYRLKKILHLQGEEKSVQHWTKRLLQGFLILYLVQKNGSLGVEIDEKVNKGDVDFLQALFSAEHGKRQNDGDYFQEVLKPLLCVFWCTNTNSYEILGKKYRRVSLSVPQEEVHRVALIPNSFFQNGEDGIWDVFGRFSFHVLEYKPWDMVVAINPEILGRTNELLLNENDRDEQIRGLRGVFYTPRKIVHYMCQTALVQYLHEKNNKIPLSILEVLKSENIVGQSLLGANDSNTQLLYTYAEELDAYLGQVQVCDPSVGSGAFSSGMMHEIVRMRQNLLPNRKESVLELKRQATASAIFGVDIDKEAIEIARLRMWFSLIGEEGKIQDDILNSLAQNFVWGDSLQSEFIAGKEQTETWYDVQKAKRKPFFTEEVVNRSGFDIVIGNPPYGASIANSEMISVEKRLGGVPDKEIYYYFIQLAKQLIHDRGFLSYIIPNTWMTNTHAFEYRKNILDNWNIIEVIDCTKCCIFGDATVFNSIILFQNGKTEFLGYKESDQSNLVRLLQQPRKTIPKAIFAESEDWSVLCSQKYEHFKRIQKLRESQDVVCLRTYALVKQGMKPYDFAVRRDHCPDKDTWEEISGSGKETKNKYRQKRETIRHRVFHSQESKECRDKWLKGVDITPFAISWETRTRGDRYVLYGDWLATPCTRAVFEEERILIREIISPSIYATITDKAYFHDPGVISIKNKDGRDLLYVLLGILHSKIGNFILFNGSMKTNKQRFPKILIKVLQEFPIPTSIDTKNPITEALKVCVQKRLEDPFLIQIDAEEYNDEAIDALVFQIYPYTKEDIEHIKGWRH